MVTLAYVTIRPPRFSRVDITKTRAEARGTIVASIARAAGETTSQERACDTRHFADIFDKLPCSFDLLRHEGVCALRLKNRLPNHDFPLLANSPDGPVNEETMFAATRRWFRRNRTPITVTVGLVGAGYVVTQYIVSKLNEARERMSNHRIAKEKYMNSPRCQTPSSSSSSLY